MDVSSFDEGAENEMLSGEMQHETAAMSVGTTSSAGVFAFLESVPNGTIEYSKSAAGQVADSEFERAAEDLSANDDVPEMTAENALCHENIVNEAADNGFNGFATAIAHIVEQRDPATGGHAERVAALSAELARTVSEAKAPPFSDVVFSPQQVKELHCAALLHDVGKLVVHEEVLLKCHKLHAHELKVLRMRFDLVRASRERDLLQRKHDALLALKNDDEKEGVLARFAEWDEVAQREANDLDEALDAVTRANNPLSQWLDDDDFKVHCDVLARLSQSFYHDRRKRVQPLLSEHELECLMVREGSLSPIERRDVERHATYSFEFLSQIPWANDYASVPQIAYCHHERNDGSGYPRGLKREQIPLQSRIIAVCDTYDALVSNDRPYQRARANEEAMEILRDEAQVGRLESGLVRLFIECGVWKATFRWRRNPKVSVAA